MYTYLDLHEIYFQNSPPETRNSSYNSSRLISLISAPNQSPTEFLSCLSGSSLNAGNFGAAKRLFVETTLEHLWLSVAPSLQTLLPRPSDRALLRHDIRDVPFVRQDAKDLAEIQALQMQVLRNAGDGGWEPDAAVRWLLSADLSELLGHHTGLLSVQLQEPGSNPAGAPPALPPAQGA